MGYDVALRRVQKLYPAVQQAIRAGLFLPNRSSNLCSRKYCSFWRRCEREFGGKVAGYSDYGRPTLRHC